jgi:MFS family permease
MATTFLSLYLLKKLQLPTAMVGHFLTIDMASRVVFGFLAGKIGDKYGHRINLIIGGISWLLICFFSFIAINLIYCYFIFALFGLMISFIFTSEINLILEFAPSGKKPTYFALSSTLSTPAFLVMTFINGYLAELAGGDYLFVFLTSILLIVLFLLLIIFTVHEPRRRIEGVEVMLE